MAADLSRISLFQGLKLDDLRALGARTEVRELPADTMLIKQGDPADSLLAILKGKVKVYLVDANGQEFVVDVRGAGGYVGEMMLDDKPRSAWVKTLEPSSFAVIPRNEFKALLMANPELSLQVIKNLIRLARGTNIRTLEDVRTRGELQALYRAAQGHQGQGPAGREALGDREALGADVAAGVRDPAVLLHGRIHRDDVAGRPHRALALLRVFRQEGVDLLYAQLGLAGNRLRAHHAVHPLHVFLHARHDRAPFRRGMALRVGQHVALAARERGMPRPRAGRPPDSAAGRAASAHGAAR